MHRFLIFSIACTAAAFIIEGCGSDDCADTATCAPEGGNAATGGGPQGGGPQGGGPQGGGQQGGGGTMFVPTCENGSVDVGEVCFTEPHMKWDGQGQQFADMVVMDCDGDSDLDILVIGNSAVSALRNDGAGNFPVVVTTGPLSANYGGNRIAGGQIFSIAGRRIIVDRPGLNQAQVLNLLDDCVFQASNTMDLPVAGVGVQGLIVADVNDTGFDDVIVLNGNQYVMGLDGNLSTTYPSANAATGAVNMTTADLDGNIGFDPIIADQAANKVRWGLVSGLNIDVTASYQADVGSAPSDVAAGDLDGDGDNDIVSANEGSSDVSVLMNSGTALFTKLGGDISISSTTINSQAPRGIALGDVDNDGDLDVATANADDTGSISSVSLLLNDGDGNLTLASAMNFANIESPFPIQVERQPVTIALVDLNGDGALDIVTSHIRVEATVSFVSVLLAQP